MREAVCSHFAAVAEPANAQIKARAAALTTPSTPSTITEELATNPFVRPPDVSEFTTSGLTPVPSRATSVGAPNSRNSVIAIFSL